MPKTILITGATDGIGLAARFAPALRARAPCWPGCGRNLECAELGYETLTS